MVDDGGLVSPTNERTHIMKNLSRILAIAAVAALFGLTNSASAQNTGYRATGDDGITASPKQRQFLNEHRTVASAPTTTVATAGYRVTSDDGIVASPKHRQQINERRTGTSSTAVAATGYRATGNDGITASPKHRQQLNERGAAFMVAPLK